MYAVIKIGGKQHRVSRGNLLKLEKLEVTVGDSIKFEDVLLVAYDEVVFVGTPIVEGAVVSAEVLKHSRSDKVGILKFRRRKHSMKRQIHRQCYTEVKITDIISNAGKKISSLL